MPGFVDVSNMSDLEIKRLGQMDDDEGWQPRRNTRRNPYGYNNTNRPTRVVPSESYSVSDVWAAACAANRVNGGYFKEYVYEHLEDQPLSQPPAIVKRRNRDLVLEFLQNPHQLLVEDVEAGEECRKFLQNDITFRALKNKLTEFDSATSKVLAVTDRFDTFKHRYELAVIASLPASYQRALERQAVQERMRQTSGTLVGNPGDKVQLDVEIVKSSYSQKWTTWYSTAVTPDNRAVFFAYRQQLGVGSKCTIHGTVKSHRDGTTQLNRVSIIGA